MSGGARCRDELCIVETWLQSLRATPRDKELLKKIFGVTMMTQYEACSTETQGNTRRFFAGVC